MERLIILPVGLSITRNLKKNFDLELPLAQEEQILKQHLSQISGQLPSLSVELSILSKLKATSDDFVVLILTSDTDEAESAARANAFLVKQNFRANCELCRVQGLDLNDAEKFLKEGLRKFFSELDRWVDKAGEKGLDPIIGVAGGIKPVLLYAAVYGMLRSIPLYYVLEQTQALVRLPPLPIDFDWEALQNLTQLLPEFEKEGAVPLGKLTSALGLDFFKLEGLFEVEGNLAFLSAFGFLLLNTHRKARELPVMLSPPAKKKLESLSRNDQQEIERLLDRVRNPLWRAQKFHSFSGTDLLVIKPGNTQPRLAICAIKNGQVYVAEVYAVHDKYELDLPKHRRADYNLKDFEPHWPKVPEVSQEALKEAKGDEVLALALARAKKAEEEAKKAEKERDEAREFAQKAEERAKHAEKEALRFVQEMEAEYKKVLKEAQERLSQLEKKEKERSSWSFWRRLRWALFRS